MKKIASAVISCLLTSVSVFAYSGGTGTEWDPYQISSKADMEELASNVNGGRTYSGVYFRLTRDLTGAGDVITTVIGSSGSFCGIFDGDGHKLGVNIRTANDAGVFGRTDGAVIKNLGVEGSVIAASDAPCYAGGICGRAYNTVISSCYNTADVSATLSATFSPYVDYYSYSGGLCGYIEGNVTVSDCYNLGAISATINITSAYSPPIPILHSYSGGLCGYVEGSITVSNCYNRGTILSTTDVQDNFPSAVSYSYSGGLCGYVENGITVSNCYNVGAISSVHTLLLSHSHTYSGGICAYIGGDVAISNCRNTGMIFSSGHGGMSYSYSGGLYGCVEGGSAVIRDCHNTGDVFSGPANQSYSGGLCGNWGTVTNSYNTGTISCAVGGFSCNSGGICGMSGTVTNCYNTGDVSSTGNSYSGGICGRDGTVTNCYNTGAISAQGMAAGGICGTGGTITNCHNMGTVSSATFSGGICGGLFGGATIRNCYNTGEIFGSICFAGICGGDYGDEFGGSGSVTINNCYNTGAISFSDFFGYPLGSSSDSGGICGRISANSKVTNCFSANVVLTTDGSQSMKAGRIVGNNEGTMENNYALATMLVNGIATSNQDPNSPDGKDATQAQFQNQSWLISNLAWDFADVWCIPGSGRFPEFRSQYSGDLEVTILMSLPEVRYGDRITLSATSNNTVAPIVYTSSDNSIAEISGAQLTAKTAGTVTITASQAAGNGFAPGSASIALTILRKELTVTADPATMTYGDTPPAYTCQYSGFVNGENEGVLTTLPSFSCNATSQSNVGTYAITPSGAAAQNYSFIYQSGTLTIDQAPVTIVAQSATSIYGDTPPAYTCQYSGFMNGETESVLAQLPSFSCDATSQSNVGTYTITPEGASARNYSFSYVNGTLTIQKRDLQVTPDNVSRAYGDANPVFTLAYSGFVNGDTASDIDAEPTATTTATSYSSPGEYTIACSGGSATNYSFTHHTGKLTITKAPLTITANNAVRRQGEDNPVFTLAYEGFKNNETESVLDVLPTIACVAEKTSPMGFYDIVLSGGSDNNYDYDLVDGRLEVTLPNGIDDVSASKISIYPNPVKHDLYIQSESLIEKVEIYNQAGILVLVDKAYSGKMDVSRLAAGVYFVRVYVDEGVETKKIIVKE